MHWALHRMPFGLIVGLISHQPEVSGRVVVDKTGLSGLVDCEMSWAGDGPSFFTALQEQMGLKLQPETGQVETIAIDSIEQPSEN